MIRKRRNLEEDLTQGDFNRYVAAATAYDQYHANISPKEKNNLYADIKDFQEEFRDLQNTAEKLPDEYIDQMCSSSSYPFNDVIDEVNDVEDWCQEAEEFLKGDIDTLYYGDLKKKYNDGNYRTYEATVSQTARYAKARHDRTGVTRKHSGEPYIVHPNGVAALVKAYGGTEDQIKAAYLHDTMEDTGETADHIAEQFGKEVADIVSQLTNDSCEVSRLGKENYINQKLVSLPHEALLVKLCDIYYNQMDYPNPEQAARQLRNIDYLLANRSDLTESELDVIDAILARNNI